MDDVTSTSRSLTDEEKRLLNLQDSRIVPEHKAIVLENNARKYWDLFYKRNETRFFKDRHWTTREFEELTNDCTAGKKVVLEVGCGVGNFIFPLIEEGQVSFAYACDLSPRAIEFVKNNKLYKESVINAFQCDITTDDVHSEIKPASIDISTLIFVLSAIHPDKFSKVLSNIFKLLKPGGLLLFRDYGLHDMSQIRFKAGHKIAENFYMRQDGTRSYFFSTELMESLFKSVGFDIIENMYVHRRTVNKKESIDVPRIFVQTKAAKPK